jgi:hypothetical protein
VPITSSPRRHEMSPDDFGTGVDLVLGLRAAARAAAHYPLSPDAFLSALDLMLEVRAAARRYGRLADPDGSYDMRAATAAAEQLLAAIGVAISTDPASATAEVQAELVEHRTRIVLTAGGVYTIHCSCGGYDATAPTTASAERAAAEHRRAVR